MPSLAPAVKRGCRVLSRPAPFRALHDPPSAVIPRPLSARRPGAPLHGTAAVPGDKSISHRALMFGALAVGETGIAGLLEGEDVLRTAAAMRALGAEVTQDGPGRWRVAGRGLGGLVEPADVLDMGNSGTAARLLCGILASHDLHAVMTGDASLRAPADAAGDGAAGPVRRRFDGRAGGRLPLSIRGARDALPIEYRLPVASAQVKSALLLAGLNAPGWTVIEEPEPTRDHSERMLRHFGAEVEIEVAGRGRVVGCADSPSCAPRTWSCRATRPRPRSRSWRRCWCRARASPCPAWG